MESEEHARPMTPVHVCWDDNEANIVVSVLREQGIEAQLNSEIPHSVMPLTADGLGEVRVLVDEDKAQEARQIIESYRTQEDSNIEGSSPEGD